MSQSFNVFNILLYLLYFLYLIFSVRIIRLALVVRSKLRDLADKIARTKADGETKANQFQDAESYLLFNSPDFPLSALARILPGTFVGFGILGTFLGFSGGISGMRLSGNVEELFGKLDIFFSGLTTAFITSIIGVILSVIFGTIFQWPLNKIRFHCERIRNELSVIRSPAERAKNEFGQYIQSIQEMTRTLLAAKESIETLPQRFLDVGKSLEESVAPVKETFGVMQATLENYSRQAEVLQNASAQIQSSLTKFIETSEQTTEKVNASLDRTITATKDIQENNARLNADYQKMLDDYKALHETLSSIQAKISEEVASYSDEIKSHFSQLLTAYSEQSREILQNQNAQMLEERRETLKEYQEIDGNIASILETVNKNLADYSAAVESTLVQTLAEYNKAAHGVAEAFFGEEK